MILCVPRSPRRRGHAKRDRNLGNREDHEPVVPPYEPDQNAYIGAISVTACRSTGGRPADIYYDNIITTTTTTTTTTTNTRNAVIQGVIIAVDFQPLQFSGVD